MALETHQTIAVVTRCEAVVLLPFVSKTRFPVTPMYNVRLRLAMMYVK
jgi:hypothetical protein